MTSLEVDVAVIGAGTAGLSAFRAARAAGARAVLIEGGAHGTTCARVGCMPSKLLIAAAEAAHAAAAAPGFGIHIDGGIRVDGREVMARVRSERDRFVSFVLEEVERIPAAARLSGHARFVDERTLEVDAHTRVAARCVVVATGSRPDRDPTLAGLGDRVVVTDDVFAWTRLPRSVAVMGPGIIGLELGQALHRLGVRVAVLGRGGRVGPLSDPDIVAATVATLRREFELAPDAGIAGIRRDGDAVVVTRSGRDGAQRVDAFELVLAATGRIPNVDGLGLERTSLQRDARGVPLFDPLTMRTLLAPGPAAGESPVFVAGDADAFLPLLHEAADEGRIAGANAARVARGEPVQPGLRRAPIGVMFTDPSVAVIGGGLRSLAAGTFVTGRIDFGRQGRSRILRRNAGLLHLYAEEGSGRLLGAELVAPAGEHLAHLLAWALQSRMTVDEMLAMPFYHPVIEEGLRTALRDASARLHPGRVMAAEDD